MKRFIIPFILLFSLMLSAFPVFGEDEVDIYNRSKAVIYNPQTKQFIFDRGGDTKTEPATSAKMVAVTILYDYFASRLDTVITVEQKHLNNIGSAVNASTPMVGIRAGNTFTVEQLLRTVCVSWANDALNPVIHTYCEENGIKYSEFSQIMTDFAISVGCTDTQYKDCLGRGEMGNLSTAKDIALLCAEFYNRYDMFIASSATYYMLGSSTIHTRNYLISERIMAGNRLQGARGFFAGQAHSTGNYCVATAVENGPLTYIVVLLDGCMYLYDEEGVRYFEEGKNPYTDVKTLVEWAKNNFAMVTLCKAGDAIAEISVAQGKDSDHLVVCTERKLETINRTGDDLSGLEIKISYDDSVVYKVTDESGREKQCIKAPVSKGDKIGMAEYILNGVSVGTTSLLAGESIDADTVINFLNTVEGILFSPTAKTIAIVVAVLFGLYLVYCIAAFSVRVVRKVKKDAAATQKEKRLKELQDKKPRK